MHNKLQFLVPTNFGIATAAAIGVTLALACNLGTILQGYGFGQSLDVVHEGIGSTVIRFLTKLDNLRFTDSAVSFLVWAVVGISVLFVLSSVVRAYQTIRSEVDIASNNYVKPIGFHKTELFREVLTDNITLVLGFFGLAFIFTLSLRVIWPHANANIQYLLQNAGPLSTVAHLLVGVLLYVATVAVFMYMLYVMAVRHRLITPE